MKSDVFEKLLLDFLAKHYRDAAHSIFAPSGSAMWMTCPGSLIPNLLAPDDAGIEAAEGTVAHSLGEQWLKSGECPDDRVGEVVQIREGSKTFDITITDEMIDFVGDYVDWCINLPGKHYVEQRVYFSRLTPIEQQGGTADHFVCAPGKLIITDLKYGLGVKVFAENNSQAMLYALGVFYKLDHLYDFQEIVIRIAQPRMDHFDEWVTDRKTLLAFAREVKEAAERAWTLNAPLSPSEKACRWCKVKASCPAYLAVVDRIADEAFSDIDFPVCEDEAAEIADTLAVGLFDPKLKLPTLIPTADLVKALPYRKAVESWFKKLEEELEQRALNGEDVPGHKLVETLSRRQFIDTADAEARLGEAGLSFFNLYKLDFVSPAGAEELLRKMGYRRGDEVEFLKPVVIRPPGKPTLVPSDDPRPAYVPPADHAFDDIDDDL